MSSEGKPTSNDEYRIWVGNLDPRMTEYQLLKLVQKCGPIKKFDLLFHKGGPFAGQSRGYAFVTFVTAEGVMNALEKLDGTMVANRSIAVRLAKGVNYNEMERPKPRIEIPALGPGKREERLRKEDAIRAIEQQLKYLECNSGDLNFQSSFGPRSTGPPEVPIVQRYQFNKDREANVGSGQRSGYGTRAKLCTGPYNRTQRPKRR